MTERTLQGALEAAITAQEAGAKIDWQAMCVEVYNVAMAEIKRLQPPEPTLMDQAMEMMEGQDLPMG